MNKRSIIIIVLILACILLLSFIFGKTKVSKVSDQAVAEPEKVDLVKLEQSYKVQAGGLLTKADEAVAQAKISEAGDGAGLTIEAVKSLKNELISLKLTESMKDFHLKLLMGINKLEDYLESRDNYSLTEAEKMVNEARLSADWL